MSWVRIRVNVWESDLFTLSHIVTLALSSKGRGDGAVSRDARWIQPIDTAGNTVTRSAPH
eukprot:2898697-Rhodomonas_salina.5